MAHKREMTGEIARLVESKLRAMPKSSGSTTSPITVSSTAPSTPTINALWINTANNTLSRWSGTAWVSIGGGTSQGSGGGSEGCNDWGAVGGCDGCNDWGSI